MADRVANRMNAAHCALMISMTRYHQLHIESFVDIELGNYLSAE